MPPSPAPLFSRLSFRLPRCAAVSISTLPSSTAPLRYGPHPRLASPFPLSPPCRRILRAAAAVSSLDLRPIVGGFALFSMAAASSATSVHDFTVKDASGKDVDLSTYKGKVLLIVNVASQWELAKAGVAVAHLGLHYSPPLDEASNGLTNSNYTELSQLYEKYKDQGFEILAFPCNQFGGQEPGTNEEIVQFACTRFKVEYPIFDKVDVNGNNTAPIYKFLKSSKGSLFGENIKWNFSKFLVDKEGRVVERYAPTTSPLSIEKDIKKLLGSS